MECVCVYVMMGQKMVTVQDQTRTYAHTHASMQIIAEQMPQFHLYVNKNNEVRFSWF